MVLIFLNQLTKRDILFLSNLIWLTSFPGRLWYGYIFKGHEFLKFNIYPYLKNISSIFVLQGIGAIMTFVSQIYLIKILGLDEYGLFVF